mmetsp:Transcript_139572/g.445402  ORF Transcript_139572/g.445402 Transcript_139572/m.445402 type:complete len:979 (-) Transcript_139572:63-2999(-)
MLRGVPGAAGTGGHGGGLPTLGLGEGLLDEWGQDYQAVRHGPGRASVATLTVRVQSFNFQLLVANPSLFNNVEHVVESRTVEWLPQAVAEHQGRGTFVVDLHSDPFSVVAKFEIRDGDDWALAGRTSSSLDAYASALASALGQVAGISLAIAAADTPFGGSVVEVCAGTLKVGQQEHNSSACAEANIVASSPSSAIAWPGRSHGGAGEEESHGAVLSWTADAVQHVSQVGIWHRQCLDRVSKKIWFLRHAKFYEMYMRWQWFVCWKVTSTRTSTTSSTTVTLTTTTTTSTTTTQTRTTITSSTTTTTSTSITQTSTTSIGSSTTTSSTTTTTTTNSSTTISTTTSSTTTTTSTTTTNTSTTSSSTSTTTSTTDTTTTTSTTTSATSTTTSSTNTTTSSTHTTTTATTSTSSTTSSTTTTTTTTTSITSTSTTQTSTTTSSSTVTTTRTTLTSTLTRTSTTKSSTTTTTSISTTTSSTSSSSTTTSETSTSTTRTTTTTTTTTTSHTSTTTTVTTTTTASTTTTTTPTTTTRTTTTTASSSTSSRTTTSTSSTSTTTTTISATTTTSRTSTTTSSSTISSTTTSSTKTTTTTTSVTTTTATSRTTTTSSSSSFTTSSSTSSIRMTTTSTYTSRTSTTTSSSTISSTTTSSTTTTTTATSVTTTTATSRTTTTSSSSSFTTSSSTSTENQHRRRRQNQHRRRVSNDQGRLSALSTLTTSTSTVSTTTTRTSGACAEKPCAHGGLCIEAVEQDEGFVCLCTDGWIGDGCDDEVKELSWESDTDSELQHRLPEQYKRAASRMPLRWHGVCGNATVYAKQQSYVAQEYEEVVKDVHNSDGSIDKYVQFSGIVPRVYDAGCSGNALSAAGPSLTTRAFSAKKGDVANFFYRVLHGGEYYELLIEVLGCFKRQCSSGDFRAFDEMASLRAGGDSEGFEVLRHHFKEEGFFKLRFHLGSYDFSGGSLVGAHLVAKPFILEKREMIV